MVTPAVVLRGLRLNGSAKETMILQRTDQDFLPAILKELEDSRRHPELIGSTAQPGEDGVLKLFQPVHRTFHVVLFEAGCDDIGQPRLDPSRIAGSGLVVRRIAADVERRDGEPETLEGWMQREESFQGWLRLSSRLAREQDPIPELRPPALDAGHREINRMLAATRGLTAPVSESVSPLFVAHPHVCAAAKRTILYGVAPVTSMDLSEAPTVTPALTESETRSVLPPFLLSSGSGSATRAQLEEFLVGIGAAVNLERAPPVLAALDELEPTISGGTRPGTVIRQAVAQLADALPSGLPTSVSWQPITSETESVILRSVRDVLLASASGVTPREGRFDVPDRTYRLQGFIRVSRDDGCPPRLIWSEPSEPYRIAPWYEAGNVPPVRVALPDVTDVKTLRNLKPNVAFASPENTFNRMRGMGMQDILDGKQPAEDTEFGVEWVCGFSIPILTICALIVLNIFLSMLNFIFFWLPFVKICIPIPVPRPPQANP